MGIAKALGLIESEEKVEDLGDKAIQAEERGIKPEDFRTYSEYEKSIEDFETDSARSQEISEDEKALKGIELASGVTIEHFGDKFPVEEFFKIAAKHTEYFRSLVAPDTRKNDVVLDENHEAITELNVDD